MYYKIYEPDSYSVGCKIPTLLDYRRRVQMKNLIKAVKPKFAKIIGFKIVYDELKEICELTTEI